jgi:hypothetical protein
MSIAISTGQNAAWIILKRSVSLMLPGSTVVALVIPYFRGRGKKDIFASGEPDVL